MVLKYVKAFVMQCFPKPLLRALKIAYRYVIYIKDSSKFKGTNVYCPCCDKFFSGFRRFAVDPDVYNVKLYENTRLDVVCPYCLSLPRHRIICDYLAKNKTLLSDVLLFAPANSIVTWLKRHKISYISADLFDRTADIKADIQQIPFADNHFGFISCDHVLEHVPDYMSALKELFRVIKVGGCAEITVPLLPDLDTTYEDAAVTALHDRMTAFGQYDHLRIFGKDFADKLREIGFDVSIYDGNECDTRIVPLIAPAAYDYNKVFICKK